MEVDVGVVGASVAGCTAARLFAESGASVALIERRPDPNAYKVACTHAILSPATAVLERLGVASELTQRGAARTWPRFWTPCGGWLSIPGDFPRGWGVTRSTLDPVLRARARSAPGVELLTGWAPTRVLFDGPRAAGVEVADQAGRVRSIRARLVVGADGRSSSVARLARIPGRVRPHNRFFYFAYWRGMPRPRAGDDVAMRLWLLDPDAAAEFPNEDDLTLLVASFHRSRLREVRADLEGSYLRHLASLPDPPDLEGAHCVSKLLGKLELPNVLRPAAAPGIAFVGDAALATDPLFGAGITFAFQSAAWLVDETAAALRGSPRHLDAALARYRRKHFRRLAPHHLQMTDFSTGRSLTALERLLFRRATHDAEVARAFGMFLARERPASHLLHPRFAARLVVPRRVEAEASQRQRAGDDRAVALEEAA